MKRKDLSAPARSAGSVPRGLALANSRVKTRHRARTQEEKAWKTSFVDVVRLPLALFLVLATYIYVCTCV